MTAWNWTPPRSEGLWRYGPLWLKPLAVAVPWLTVLLLLMTLYVVAGTLTPAQGVLFDLPDSGLAESEATSMVALVAQKPGETLVFFDDGRYSLGDGVSSSLLGDCLAERASKVESKTLLVLADRSVPLGELTKLAAVARLAGVRRILFANKSESDRDE